MPSTAYTAVSTVPWWQWYFPILPLSQAVTNYEMDTGTPGLLANNPGASAFDDLFGSSFLTGQPTNATIQNVIKQGSAAVTAAGGGPSDVAQLQQDVNSAVNLTGGTQETLAQVASGAASSLVANVDPSTLALWVLVAVVGGIVLVKSLGK